MDILKIRKKKRQETAADELPSSPPSSSEAASSPTATPEPSRPSSAARKPPSPAPAPRRPPSSSSKAPPASRSKTSVETAELEAARPPRPPTATTTPPAPAAARTPSPTSPMSSLTSPAPTRTRASESTVPGYVDDPLLEFLARYDEGAEESTVGTSPDAHRDESKRYLAFELAGEEYAASIMEIREILRVLALTAVPRAPREILGVISKRGLVMPVIDLAATLGLREPDETWSPRQRILVVGEADRVCGLRVDRVLEVVRLRADDVEEVPASLGARSKHQLRGLGRVGDRMFILLDVAAVLHAMAVAAGLESREEVA